MVPATFSRHSAESSAGIGRERLFEKNVGLENAVHEVDIAEC